MNLFGLIIYFLIFSIEVKGDNIYDQWGCVDHDHPQMINALNVMKWNCEAVSYCAFTIVKNIVYPTASSSRHSVTHNTKHYNSQGAVTYDSTQTISACIYQSGGTVPSVPVINAPPRCPMEMGGSIIRPGDQVVGETISLVGVPFSLVYMTDRDVAMNANRQYGVNLKHYWIDSGATKIYVDVTFDGVTDTIDVSPLAERYIYTWSGKHRNGTEPSSSVRLDFSVREFPDNGVQPFTGDTSAYLGTYNAKAAGLGGWTLEGHHYFDRNKGLLYKGNGVTASARFGTLSNGDLRIVDVDTKDVLIFHPDGRHKETRTFLLNKLKYAFSYDGSLRLTSISDMYSNTTTINYNGGGTLTGITGPYGQTASLSLNSFGKLSQVTSPGSKTFYMTYHEGGQGLLASFKKPNGQITEFSYDQDGRLIKDSKVNGPAVYLDGSQDAFTRSTTTTSKGGRQTSFTTLNRSMESTHYYQQDATFPSGLTVTQDERMASGQVITRTGGDYIMRQESSDPRFPSILNYTSRKKRYNFSETNVRDYLINKSVTGYSGDPLVYTTYKSTINKNGEFRTETFTKSTAAWAISSFEGRTSSITLDPNTEKIIGSDDSASSAITYGYDGDGNLASLTQGSRGLSFAYNANGQVSSITNALSEATTFQYDTDGRMLKFIWPDSREIQYEYDAIGNITSIKPPGKNKYIFGYGIAAEVINSFLPPELSSDKGYGIYYYYDDDGLPKKITLPTGAEISYSYVNNTTKLSSISDGSLSYIFGTYGTDGQPADITSPDNLKTGMVRSGAFTTSNSLIDQSQSKNYGKAETLYVLLRLSTARVVNSSGSILHSVSLTYDHDDLLETVGSLDYIRSSSTGLLTSLTLGSLTDNFSHNSYGELDSYQSSYSSTQKYEYQLTHDLLGRIEEMTEDVLGTATVYNYIYDNSGRLSEVEVGGSTQSTYTYDTNSNKTSGQIRGANFTATYDDQDRILTWNNLEFTYNRNGERLTRRDTSNSTQTNYLWDSWGKLKKVTLPNSIEISYKYDGFGRRAIVLVNNSIQSVYMYQDNLKLVAELDASGALVSRFVWGEKMNVPEYMVKGGVTYRFITDPRGSVRLVINTATGSIAQQLDYNELGKVTNDTNPGFQPFGFAGGIYDKETKLVRFGARDYDPEIGAWTSKDPILFDGGDSNLYGYVLNDPINLVDPQGTSPLTFIGVTAGVIGWSYLDTRSHLRCRFRLINPCSSEQWLEDEVNNAITPSLLINPAYPIFRPEQLPRGPRQDDKKKTNPMCA